ncbi:MAG: sodium:solute symporter family protein [Zestosphaera sp.]
MDIIALVIIFAWLIISTAVGIMAGLRKKFSLEEWAVASRGLSMVVIFFTLAAEIYSAFTFLGLGGWAYNYGAPIYYALAYFVTAYSTGFVLFPYLNRLGRKYRYITQADFLMDRYESNALGILASVLGVTLLLPYIQLQIQGTGIIVQTASYGAIDPTTAIMIAYFCVVVFLFIGGYRGLAWTNVLQGVLMFVAAFMIFAVPFMAFGGTEPMFRQIMSVSPQHLVLPGAKGIHGFPWYMSTLLLTTLGFWMFPHLTARMYSAKSERDGMRSCAWMPWYSLLAVPIVLAGYSALLLFPGLKNPDLAVMTDVVNFFPPAIVGIIGAGGLAAAVSTGGSLIQASAVIISRNWIQKGFGRGLSDMTTAWLARFMTIVVSVISLILSLYFPTLLVNLLLIAYSLAVQFFPGMVFGITWRRATKHGIFAGILVGTIVVILTTWVWVNPYQVNAGIWGLAFNFITAILVSLATKPPSTETLKKFFTTV